MNEELYYKYFDKHFQDKHMSIDDIFRPIKNRNSLFVRCKTLENYERFSLILRHFGYTYQNEYNEDDCEPGVDINRDYKEYDKVRPLDLLYGSRHVPTLDFYKIEKYFDYLDLNDDDIKINHTKKLDCKSDDILNKQIIEGIKDNIQIEFDFTNPIIIKLYERFFNQRLDYEERIFINKYKNKHKGTKAIYMHAVCKVNVDDFKCWTSIPFVYLHINNLSPSLLKNDIKKYCEDTLDKAFKNNLRN